VVYTSEPRNLMIEDSYLMKPDGSLLAWIKPRSADEFVAAFVGEHAVSGAYRNFAGRAPAKRFCSSLDEARQWIEGQAAAFDLPVRWVSGMPQG
jgi:hypothetical protein